MGYYEVVQSLKKLDFIEQVQTHVAVQDSLEITFTVREYLDGDRMGEIVLATFNAGCDRNGWHITPRLFMTISISRRGQSLDDWVHQKSTINYRDAGTKEVIIGENK